MSTTAHTTDHPVPLHRRRASRRRRGAIAALLLAVLLVLLALTSVGGGTPNRPAASGTADAVARQPGAEEATTDADDTDAGEDARSADDPFVAPDVDLSSGDADGGDPGAGELDPMGDGAPDPCADHDAAVGNLRVVPDPVILASGDLDGDLSVRNCGADAVGWTAATKPSVTLAPAAGTLDPGEVTTIAFAIDGSAWDPGAIEFKIKVSEAGHNQYVDVQAFRPMVGADVVAGVDFAAGPGVGGCGDQCITKALIRRAATTADVSLDVATTVPAKVRVYLSKQAPIANPAGNPVFPGVAPKATSPNGVQSWTASLTGLQPTTKYFIIVRATDADGDVAYRSGSFRTITPYEAPAGGFALGGTEPGCSAQCITKATVTPGDGLAPARLTVRTHTPAQVQLMLSTDAPTMVDGVPTFAQKDVWLTNGLDYVEAWDSDVSSLHPATTYHGIVVARDANGHRSFATGTVTTDGVDVEITIHTVHVTQDGDSGKHNRGELSFAWGVGEHTVGIRGEHKMHPGDSIGFPGHDTYLVHDADRLPTVYVSGSERDADGLIELCTGGTGANTSPGGSGSCDTKWNVAASAPVHVGGLGGLGSLQECSSYGIDGAAADRPCQRLVSQDMSDDYAEFWVVVSYRIIG